MNLSKYLLHDTVYLHALYRVCITKTENKPELLSDPTK